MFKDIYHQWYRQSVEEVEIDEDVKRETQSKRVVIDKNTGKAKEVDIYDRPETKKKVDSDKNRALLSSNYEQSLIPSDLSKLCDWLNWKDS